MEFVSIKADKFAAATDPNRFVVTFHVDYKIPDDDIPYGSMIFVSIPFDESMSYRQIIESASNQLRKFFGTAAQLTADDIERLLKSEYQIPPFP